MRVPMLLGTTAAAAALLVCTSLPSAAQASTASAMMMITATVPSFCIISAANLAFGSYTATALAGMANLTSTCTVGTTYNIGLDNGQGTGATTAARKMYITATPSNTLTYSLYSDTGHSTVVGNTIGTNTISGTGTGTATTTMIYGLIPGGQYVTPGNYADTVMAIITY